MRYKHVFICLLALFVLAGCEKELPESTLPGKYDMTEAEAAAFGGKTDGHTNSASNDAADVGTEETGEQTVFDGRIDAGTPKLIHDLIIELPDKYRDVSLYSGYFWLASEKGVLKRSAFLEEDAGELFCDLDARCVTAASDGVFVLCADRLVKFGADGSLIREYPLERSVNPVRGVLCGDAYCFAAEAGDGKRHDLCLLSLSDGSLSTVPSAEVSSSGLLYVTDMQPGNGELLIASVNDMGETVLIRYSVGERRVLGESPGYDIMRFDYDAGENRIIYLSSSIHTDYVDLYEFVPDSLEEPAVVSRIVSKKTDYSAMPENVPLEILALLGVRYDALFCTGEYYYLWSRDEKTITVSDAKPDFSVTLLAPNAAKLDSSAGMGNYALDNAASVELIASLKMNSNCRLCLETVPVKSYTEKLLIKLLAGDDDFDVFVVYDRDVPTMKSVIDNGAFLPLEELKGLDGFETAMDNLSSMAGFVQPLTETDRGMFGVPLMLSSLPVMLMQPESEFVAAGLTRPTNGVSVAEYLDFYDEVRRVGAQVSGLGMTMLGNVAQRYVDTCEVDRELLVRIFAVYMEECGQPDPRPLCLQGIGEPLQKYQKGAYAGYDTVALLPTLDGITYLGAEAFVCVNPNTKHPEAAAAYLAALTSPSVTDAAYRLYVGAEPSGSADEEDAWRYREAVRVLSETDVRLETADTGLIWTSTSWQKLQNDLQSKTVTPEDAAERFLGIVRYIFTE